MAHIKRYGEYLYQLQHFGIINMYLVQEEDGLSLIDTGIASSASLIMQAIKDLQQPLRRILIPHAHSDHVGGLDKLHAHYPKAEVMISRRDGKWLTGDASLEPDEPAIPLRKQNLHVQTQPTRLLEAGDRVGSLQAHNAAGHSPGQLAFLDTRDASLIAGDAFVSLFAGGKVSVAGVKGRARWRFPLPHMATWSPELALRSAQALAKLEPRRLAVGHGQVIDNPVTQMQHACALMNGSPISLFTARGK